ncbi:hypothetical protein AURDEDRAFT_90193 [Auricularia subglabra TFB-10046 SS5]|nr:hypothetical protein AURDEDRAFT_90193 [Auricularia subglabra TFB-10046 SS5]
MASDGQPSLRSSLAYDESCTDEEIRHLRAQLQQSRTVPTLTALSTALRRRFFFGPGRLDDLRESLSLLNDTPHPTLEEIGTASLSLHPEILPTEANWVHWQPWIEKQGYMLPERLRTNWVPSWIDLPDPTDEFISPDAFGPKSETITDAIRIADGMRVFFKLCEQSASQELEIAAFFSSEPRRSDPRNHCYPLLDVLRPPLLRGKSYHILVFPLLCPLFEPDPDTVEDMLMSIIALAEGLAFMHEHNVAHQDIHYRNAMMDATFLIPEEWHPWMRSDIVYTKGTKPRPLTVLPRSQVPMKYCLTDFGMSIRYRSFEARGLVLGTGGLNRTLPEQSNTVPYDPFPADVRMFGDMLSDWQFVRFPTQSVFAQLTATQGFLGLDFLDSVVATLRQEVPSLRPTAAHMVDALRAVTKDRSRFSLQLPLRRRDSLGTPVKVWMKYLARVLSPPFTS